MPGTTLRRTRYRALALVLALLVGASLATRPALLAMLVARMGARPVGATLRALAVGPAYDVLAALWVALPLLLWLTAARRVRAGGLASWTAAWTGIAAALATFVAGAWTRASAQPPTPANDPLAGLPLVEVPARGGAAPTTLALFVSGDGGWAALDRGTAGALADHGVAVVGVNARAYLMRRKTPEQAADDLARVARAYAARWGTRRLVLVGYSRGADLVPFVAARLPDDLRRRTALVAMLGPERNANFQFHWMDVVRDEARSDDRPLAPELERLRGLPLLCVYGTTERDTACRGADPTLVTAVARDGDHHLGGDYAALGRLILGALPAATP